MVILLRGTGSVFLQKITDMIYFTSHYHFDANFYILLIDLLVNTFDIQICRHYLSISRSIAYYKISRQLYPVQQFYIESWIFEVFHSVTFTAKLHKTDIWHLNTRYWCAPNGCDYLLMWSPATINSYHVGFVNRSQQTHHAIMTSLLRQKRRHFDVITSKWRRFDVIKTLLLCPVFRGMIQWACKWVSECE